MSDGIWDLVYRGRSLEHCTPQWAAKRKAVAAAPKLFWVLLSLLCWPGYALCFFVRRIGVCQPCWVLAWSWKLWSTENIGASGRHVSNDENLSCFFWCKLKFVPESSSLLPIACAEQTENTMQLAFAAWTSFSSSFSFLACVLWMLAGSSQFMTPSGCKPKPKSWKPYNELLVSLNVQYQKTQTDKPWSLPLLLLLLLLFFTLALLLLLLPQNYC